MGLSGRKVKQRIPNDPRNLSWADDANKFGAAYLAKLGWSSGTGLGVSGEGRTTHIKVHQKLDMLGVGAAHQKDPNGLAWKQNRDFENLLRRLNASNGEGAEETATKVDGFAKATEEVGITVDNPMERDVDEVVEKKRKRDEASEGKTKKRRKSSGEVEEGEAEKKVKKKKEKRADKEKKTKKDGVKNDETVSTTLSEATPSSPATQKPFVGRPVRAHRARFLASKRMAATSSTAVDEILGISRSGTTTPHPATNSTNFTSAIPTPLSGDTTVELQELKTSSKSVMDYFKEKLMAKSNVHSGSSTAVASTSTTPSQGTVEVDDWADPPRGGLGLGSARGGIGSSSQLLSQLAVSEKVEEIGRAGLGSSTRLSMSTMFHIGFTARTTSSSTMVGQGEALILESDTIQNSQETTKKERKGEESGYVLEREKERKDKGKEKEQVGDVLAEDQQPKQRKEDKKSKRKKSGTDLDVEVDASGSAQDDALERKKRKKEKKRKAKVEGASPVPDEAGEPRKKKKSKKRIAEESA